MNGMEIVKNQSEIRTILSSRLSEKNNDSSSELLESRIQNSSSNLVNNNYSIHSNPCAADDSPGSVPGSLLSISSSLEDANLLLTVGSAPSSRPTSPIRGLHDSSYHPVNLSLRGGSRKGAASAPVSDEDSDNNNLILTKSNTTSSHAASTSLQHQHDASSRKRRKQTHVPDVNKDERYWARRLKNNEAAKRSRDMRIKRERVIFEENARLERLAKELKSEVERMSMDNKELTLKMGLVMEENKRLKALLAIYHQQQYKFKNSNNNNNNNNNNHQLQIPKLEPL